jgi:DNA invertase Pin-like site-specific DNA recombinase
VYIADMARRPQADPNVVVGYLRVSTEDQAESGLGVAAQRKAIEQECARRGWTLAAMYEDAGASGKSLRGRTGLEAALTEVTDGRAAAIVVAKLDRLTRSLADFANLMAQARSEGWNLVALDLGIDLSTAAGEFMANVMASAAQWERRIIGQRTRDALAAKKAQGVKLGRPRVLSDSVRFRILESRGRGEGWTAIARSLNADGVATAHRGARWYPSTVRAVALAEMAA